VHGSVPLLVIIAQTRFACRHAVGGVVSAHKLIFGPQAPVPFIVGVQYKTDEVRSLCGGLVRVNMYKDQVSRRRYTAGNARDCQRRDMIAAASSVERTATEATFREEPE